MSKQFLYNENPHKIQALIGFKIKFHQGQRLAGSEANDAWRKEDSRGDEKVKKQTEVREEKMA